MQCPSRDELTACLLGRLPEVRSAMLIDHAECCTACRDVMEAIEQSSDGLTDSLRFDGRPIQVSEDCRRMISRAERLVTAESTVDDSGTASRHLLQGTVVRDYEIVRPLGEGGMGAVFLARHQRLGRNVALKVLSLRRATDAEAQRRFEQEMAIVGKLQHPGIVRALDAGEQAGLQYLVMELIDGRNLRQLIELLGRIPLASVCEIGRQAAEALHYAHQEQLIHRDVKPSNIMLASDGTVRILDLGLARWTDEERVVLTSTEQVVGSLDYMAPEQFDGGPVDPRMDIYGLACTLHFLLCGEPPAQRRSAAWIVARGPRLEQLRETLPPPLTRLLQRMLAVEPDKRIASAAEVAQQLAPFCGRGSLRHLAEEAAATGGPLETSPTPESLTSEVALSAAIKVPPNRLVGAAVIAVALLVCLTWAMGLPREKGAPHSGPWQLASMPGVTSMQQPAQEIPLFQLHQQAVRCVAYCRATSQLICGSDDASVSVRDLPHQRRISVICQFDSPVRRISVAADAPRAVCVDELGAIALIDLPKSQVVRHWPAGGFEHRPIDVALLPAGDTIIVSHANETLRALTPSRPERLRERSTPTGCITRMHVRQGGRGLVTLDEEGHVRAWTLPDLQPASVLARLAPAYVFLVTTGTGRLECLKVGPTLGRGESVTFLDADRSPGCIVSTPESIRSMDMWGPLVPCLAEARAVRIVDLRREVPEQFIYREHGKPLTVVYCLPGEDLVLTGDETGEIRLWNPPNQAMSDMLWSSGGSVDSRNMTLALRQGAWSRQAFQSTPDSQVSIKQSPGKGMTITTKIQRNGQDHTLEYQVNTQPSDRNE